MNKTILRSRGLIYRKALSQKEIIEKSLKITEKLISIEKVINAQTIGAYLSIKNEVSTYYFLRWCEENNKKIYLPKCKDKNGSMDFCLGNLDDLEQGFFGKEPKGEEAKKDLDVVIVPGVLFDLNKNRVGFGKGFYDRYLENKSSFKIGVLFEKQLSKELIDVNQYDVKMDMLITENNILL